MKRLYYLRHSIKDTNNNISLEGTALARMQGQALASVPFTHAFCGPLVRTRQTLLHFFSGHPSEVGIKGPCTEVEGIGTDELFAQITTGGWKAAVKAGKSNFEAVLEAHHSAQVGQWAKDAYYAVKSMFNKMNSGETAVAFGHSPIIELVAYALLNNQLAPEYRTLKEMEGIVFEEEFPPIGDFPDHSVRIAARISKPQAQASAAPVPKQ